MDKRAPAKSQTLIKIWGTIIILSIIIINPLGVGVRINSSLESLESNKLIKRRNDKTRKSTGHSKETDNKNLQGGTPVLKTIGLILALLGLGA